MRRLLRLFTGAARAALSARVEAADANGAAAGALARGEMSLPPDWMTNKQGGAQGGACIAPQKIESEKCRRVTDTQKDNLELPYPCELGL